MKRKVNKFFVLLVVCGAVLFGVIAYIVMKSTATVPAVVPNQNIAAGTRVDETMITTVQVPANTPEGFINDQTSIVGQKMKVNVNQNQLLYVNDFMSSWDSFSDESIPDDYVITSLYIPAYRAIGGMLTAGDTVDILGVPNSQYSTTSKETMASYIGDVSKNCYGADGMNVYWVLSNVKILETDSSLSESNDASISNVTDSGSDGNYYIVALSYDDYKKVRLTENYLNFWLSITPNIVGDKGSDLELMGDSVIHELQDAQKQSKIVANDDANATNNKADTSAKSNEKLTDNTDENSQQVVDLPKDNANDSNSDN